jgi:hypothetical protein
MLYFLEIILFSRQNLASYLQKMKVESFCHGHRHRSSEVLVATWLLLSMSMAFGQPYFTWPDLGLKVDPHCAVVAGKREARYCWQLGMASRDILYYMHGKSANEKTWFADYSFGAFLRDQWYRRGRLTPTVVSVSFGGDWLLAPTNSGENSGLLELFVETVMPAIETSMGFRPRRRYVTGESMGGFNAAELALKTKLFDRAALLCVPLSNLSPFASPLEIQNYVQTTSVWKLDQETHNDQAQHLGRNIEQWHQTLQRAFSTPDEWAAADPLHLAQTADPSTGPRLYVSVGFYDQYAGFEGTNLLVNTLQGRGFHVEWRPLWGDHCTVDVFSLADFLTP